MPALQGAGVRVRVLRVEEARHAEMSARWRAHVVSRDLYMRRWKPFPDAQGKPQIEYLLVTIPYASTFRSKREARAVADERGWTEAVIVKIKHGDRVKRGSYKW